MIRKILKWIGIVLGSFIGLLVLAFIVLYLIGSAKWNKLHGKYDVSVETIPIPTDPASIARGEHIATIRMCRECHTEDLSGQFDTAPGMITLTVPNLTAGAGGIGATNTDEDWVRAIRHGVGYDGRGLVLMPSGSWYYLSDEDLGALIAYLKSLPPKDNEMPKTDLGPLGRVMLALGQLPPEIVPNVVSIDHDGPRPVAPEPGVTLEYGMYLARTCMLCHGSELNGRIISEGGPEKYLALNLTPGGEMKGWSEEDFITTMRTGVTPSGHQLKDVMPWKYFGQMTDDELKAVWMYLQSLPALPQGK
ncbi:MAG TPA: c-type cytochrome [Anaerolineales bacterium]|nr:c-type cytochrome [Anaerolineales bacterium]